MAWVWTAPRPPEEKGSVTVPRPERVQKAAAPPAPPAAAAGGKGNCGRWEMGDGRWEMGDGRWEMGVGLWWFERGKRVARELHARGAMIPVRLAAPVYEENGILSRSSELNPAPGWEPKPRPMTSRRDQQL